MFDEGLPQNRLAGGDVVTAEARFPRGRIVATLAVSIALVLASVPQGALGGSTSDPGVNEDRGVSENRAAASRACRPYLSQLRRRENRFWVWYAPRGWGASWNRNGIDITPRTGPSMAVSSAWAGWPVRRTHRWVFNNFVRPNVPGRVRVLSRSRITSQGGVSRRVWQWRTRRIRGRSTTFVSAQGFQVNTNAARIRLWKTNRRLLNCIQSRILYKPN